VVVAVSVVVAVRLSQAVKELQLEIYVVSIELVASLVNVA
jgi:hypothetical protein